jgi:triacylglycerol lipase
VAVALLTGAQAAIFADLAYDTASATDSAGAAWRAKGSLAAERKSAARRCSGTTPGKDSPLADFEAGPGLSGQSGNFAMRETSGFGALFERKTHDGRELVVAFRGSQTAVDWISNFNAAMEPGPGGSIVHAGFNRVYQTISDELRSLIDAARPVAVHFVGHSLGGALATLAMADHGLETGGRACHLYTFGTPRIGGTALGSQLRRILTPRSVRRVYALADPIPMLPLLPFRHFAPGATGLVTGHAFIAAQAHDRVQYRNQMPSQGWPAPLPLAVTSDPAYWLGRAERAPAFSAAGYHALSLALRGIMAALNGISIGFAVGLTALDRLVDALQQTARLSRQMGEITLRFVKAALQLVGQTALRAAVTAADLTEALLRMVLEMLHQPVERAARSALAHAA